MTLVLDWLRVSLSVGRWFEVDLAPSSVFIRLPFVGEGHWSPSTGLTLDPWSSLV